MLQSEIQEAKDDSCYLSQPLRRIRLKEKVNIQKLQYIVDISKLWLVKVRNRKGKKQDWALSWKTQRKGWTHCHFHPKRRKKTIFCWLPITSRSHPKRWDNIKKKTTTTIDIDTENVHPRLLAHFLQTEWYWNSNVELVHRKSWSESRWWSLYNSREIKHKKSFWLSLMEGGM